MKRIKLCEKQYEIQYALIDEKRGCVAIIVESNEKWKSRDLLRIHFTISSPITIMYVAKYLKNRYGDNIVLLDYFENDFIKEIK